MKALFISRNLIGDGIQISAALRVWYAAHFAEYDVTMLTNNDHVAELYKGMGVPLDLIYDYNPATDEPYDFKFDFDISKAFQICDKEQVPMAVGYAKLLGVELGQTAEDIGPFYTPPILDEDNEWVSQVPDGCILIAPFSNSCTSHEGKPPNKTIPWVKWKPIIRFLRTFGLPLRLTGSKKERADELSLSEEEYLTGIPLRPLARAMQEGRIKLLVSVDNGISHLAASQKIDHILYYPLCLGLHYAVPWGNKYCMPIQMDPAVVEPGQLQWSTKQALKTLEQVHAEENTKARWL